jgi:hypothetical protein
MTLTGDPVEVYDAFAGQAARMGFRMQSSALVCTFSGDDGLLYAPDGNAAGWTQRPDDADALFCGTTSEVYRGEDVENAAYLQLAVSQGELAGETQSTVVLDLRRHGVVPEAAPEPAPEPGCPRSRRAGRVGAAQPVRPGARRAVDGRRGGLRAGRARGLTGLLRRRLLRRPRGVG